MKVLDSLPGAIPFVSMFINPAYGVTMHGRDVVRVKKEPAFFEGKFRLEALDKVTDAMEHLVLPSVIMMLLLERERG